MNKREQRLLIGFAERSNFTENKVKHRINHVKIKTVSHYPVSVSFLFFLKIGQRNHQEGMLGNLGKTTEDRHRRKEQAIRVIGV